MAREQKLPPTEFFGFMHTCMISYDSKTSQQE